MKRLLSIAIAFVLFGATPSLGDYATNSGTTGATSVTMNSGTAPWTTCGSGAVTGCDFVFVYYSHLGTSPSLSGTWNTLCTNSTHGYVGAYERAVTSSDTSSSVTLLASGVSNSAEMLFLVKNGAGNDDAANCNSAASYTVTFSATATVTGDLGVEGNMYYTAGSGLTTASYTVCSGFTNSNIATGSTSSSIQSRWALDSESGLSAGTVSCAPSWTNEGTQNIGGALVLVKASPVASWQPFGIWRSYCGLWPDAILPNLGF